MLLDLLRGYRVEGGRFATHSVNQVEAGFARRLVCLPAMNLVVGEDELAGGKACQAEISWTVYPLKKCRAMRTVGSLYRKKMM